MNYAVGESTTELAANDIRSALELGLDGFAIDAFSGKQANSVFAAFASAADALGATNFKLFSSADMSLGFSAAEIVDVIKTNADSPHYLRVNGKPVLSTFGGTNLGNNWWKSNVLAPLSAANRAVTFIPYFDRANPNRDPPDDTNWKATIERFPSIDGLFSFGIPGSTPFYSRDDNIGRHWWSILEAEEALARSLHESGKLFMAPYSPYYWAVCHPSRQYLEFQSGRGMNSWWQSIVEKQHPDLVQIVTWNDYSESTFIQPNRIPSTKTPGIPSFGHLGYYELLKYYIAWFHKGTRPTISRDGIFFFYRTAPKDSVASNDRSVCRLGPIPTDQQWGNIKDAIYVTVALTEPAELIVSSGSTSTRIALPAGLTTIDVPFHSGDQTFVLRRHDSELIRTSGAPIVASPEVINFNVYSGYALLGAHTSQSWLPSDAWRNGKSSEWFVAAAASRN